LYILLLLHLKILLLLLQFGHELHLTLLFSCINLIKLLFCSRIAERYFKVGSSDFVLPILSSLGCKLGLVLCRCLSISLIDSVVGGAILVLNVGVLSFRVSLDYSTLGVTLDWYIAARVRALQLKEPSILV